MNSSDLYLLSDSIVWVESITYGRHSILHTTEGDFSVSASTSTLLEEHPDFLMRCHKCYLINPKHIVNIERFSVTLINNTKLPIPEKNTPPSKKRCMINYQKIYSAFPFQKSRDFERLRFIKVSTLLQSFQRPL